LDTAKIAVAKMTGVLPGGSNPDSLTPMEETPLELLYRFTVSIR
jgi:hypothetical protein